MFKPICFFILVLLTLNLTSLIAQFPEASGDELLPGAVDFHVHTSPDIFDRALNDFEAARLAKRFGLSAMVLKNHVSSTAARAELVNEIVSEIEVFGGIVLNKAVGGINPEAVRRMIQMSSRYGKVVWLPTFDAAYHMQQFNLPGKGLRILDQGTLIPEMLEVLDLIAENGLVLATGHLSFEEIAIVVKKASELGIGKILITHPLSDAPGLTLQEMKQLAEAGAIFELTYISYLSGPQAPLPFLRTGRHVPISEMVKAIKEIGSDHFLLSSDLGQPGNPHPADGLRQFAGLLMAEGISREAIDMMIKTNPKKLLGMRE